MTKKTSRLIAAIAVFSLAAALNYAGATMPEEPASTASTVSAITLAGDGAQIKWSVDGYSANGFKVVWSKNEGPTYPLRDGDRYHYYSDPKRAEDKLEPFVGAGAYHVRVCEYLGGKCGLYSNEITVELAAGENVEMIQKEKEREKALFEKKLEMEKKERERQKEMLEKKLEMEKKMSEGRDGELDDIAERSRMLSENKIDDILSELKELRSLVREQQAELKYMKSLVKDMSAITEGMQNSINSFVAYGVDENTKKLGEGERAAVIHSFKKAFNKLPENEEELADAIKIANGRWPSKKSEDAEKAAKEKFEEIYNRPADADNVRDNAAVTIMAYGLRQKAENRKVESEKNGLKIFKDIFGHLPTSTDDWNTLQAITYSGAKK